jgi:hypothetical protein
MGNVKFSNETLLQEGPQYFVLRMRKSGTHKKMNVVVRILFHVMQA